VKRLSSVRAVGSAENVRSQVDIRFRLTRTRLGVCVALLGLLTAGGVAYAAMSDTGGVINACMLKVTGTIRLYDASAPSSSLVSKPCNAALETPISWNKQGLQGLQGLQGAKGDTGSPGSVGPQGPAGKDGTNGAAGAQGLQGPPGPKGDAGTFSGTLQSPNGQYSLSLTDTGAVLSGPGGTVKIGSSSIDVVGSSGGSVHVTPGVTSIQGALMTLNGCNKPVARLGDSVVGAGFFAGTEPHQQVAPWDGLYLPYVNATTFLPLITSLDQVFVPTMAANVTVAGAISTGGSSVCTG
jgi:hypothetical protein